MKIKLRMGVFALSVFPLLLIQPVARADSFSFTFQGATDSAEGILVTDPLSYSPECSPNSGGCYAIRSMTGLFDGQAIATLLPIGDYWGLLSPSLQLLPMGAGVGFTVGTQIWGLTSNTPQKAVELFGIAAYYPDHTYSTSNNIEPVTLIITRASESDTLVLLAFGSVLLLVLRLVAR